MGKWFYVWIFLCLGLCVYSQSDYALPKNLKEKIEENHNRLIQDPAKAFHETDELLKEAIHQKDTEAELRILSQRSFYHYMVLDIEKAIEANHLLKSKAALYNDFFYQSIAHRNIAQAYIDSELYEKAMIELDSADQLLSKVTENNSKVHIARANQLHVRGSLHMEYLNQPKKGIKKVREAIHEIKKIEDEKLKNKVLHLYYSNIGLGYTVLDMDSAEFFVNKSLELKNFEETEGMAMFINYMTLGKVYKSREEYSTAVSYYLKAAESLDAMIGSLPHLEMIYKDLTEIYEITGDQVNLDHYTNKLNKVQLQISNNKNKSLHKVINESPKQGRSMWPIVIPSALIILCLIVLLMFLFRKNKRLARQEKKSQEYLQEKITSLNERSYNGLIELAKNKDDTFLAEFHKALPDFSQKILSINPTIAQTEVEFCALLKLNLSTKEIAQIQNIQPKTVQNKKNRIRKRLDIPHDMDIYYYFNQFL